MPPRDTPPGRIGLVRWILLSAFVCCAPPLAAQELQLRRDYPGSRPFECPTPGAITEGSDRERAQASQLASEADNAVILGDYGRAEQLLEQASELDPASAEVAYSRARVLETLERPEAALLEYCRAIARGAADLGILDSQARIDALDEALRASISPAARRLFASGLTGADMGFYDAAVTSFTDALEELPNWPEALYNRAVVLDRMGLMQRSLRDYRAYLALTPEAVDPGMASVAERIGLLEGLGAIPTPSPGNTLAFGVIFPGLGHYYSGRTRTGSIVLGAVVGAVATGLVVKKVTIRCLDAVPAGSDCPPDHVVDETTERPYMGAAIGMAAAVTVGAAVEAWFRARRRRAEQEAPSENVVGLAGPSLRSNGDRLDLSVLSFRFR
jgi:tetratricopeptide (TPR) repeat protein